MRILYLHGLGAVGGGYKQSYLRSLGYDVLAPHLPDDDFAESLRIAQAAYDGELFDVVIGSSRGGAVAMNIETRATPLILIAPAWKHCGTQSTVKAGTRILHSPHDELIPIEESRELARRSHLPADALIEIGERHGMSDEAALAALAQAIEESRSD